jgi:hypothetical protein
VVLVSPGKGGIVSPLVPLTFFISLTFLELLRVERHFGKRFKRAKKAGYHSTLVVISLYHRCVPLEARHMRHSPSRTLL